MGRTNVPLNCKSQTNKQPWRGLVGPWASSVTAAFKMPWWSLGAHTLTDASEAAGGVWPRAPGPRSWFGRLCYTGCMRSHNKRRWRHWPSLDTCCLQVLLSSFDFWALTTQLWLQMAGVGKLKTDQTKDRYVLVLRVGLEISRDGPIFSRMRRWGRLRKLKWLQLFNWPLM